MKKIIIQFKKDIKQFIIQSNQNDIKNSIILEYNVLTDFIHSSYKLNNDQYTLTYIDSDNDKITIKNQLDLNEALYSIKSNDLILLLNINKNELLVPYFIKYINNINPSNASEIKIININRAIQIVSEYVKNWEIDLNDKNLIQIKNILIDILHDNEFIKILYDISKLEEFNDILNNIITIICLSEKDINILMNDIFDKNDLFIDLLKYLISNYPKLNNFLPLFIPVIIRLVNLEQNTNLNEKNMELSGRNNIKYINTICCSCGTSPIKGSSYSSCTSNYDLCSKCEKIDLLRILFGPFIKINEHSEYNIVDNIRKMNHKKSFCNRECRNVFKHWHVACDGCDMCPIVGIRYKSYSIPNFDLCSKCESSFLYQETHGPFIKIITHFQEVNPVSVIVSDKLPETFVSMDTNMKKLSVSLLEDNISKMKTQKNLNSNNNLSPIKDDVEDEKKPIFETEKVNGDESVDDNRILNTSNSFSISSISIPDGSILHKNEVFLKCWEILNDSPNSTFNTEGYYLEYIEGENLIDNTDDIKKCNNKNLYLLNQKNNIVAIQMKAPSVGGRYLSYYNLCKLNGERLMERIVVDIFVDDEIEEVTPNIINEKEQEVIPSSKWSDGLNILLNMGFFDIKKNNQLMDQFNGDIRLVVNSLCK